MGSQLLLYSATGAIGTAAHYTVMTLLVMVSVTVVAASSIGAVTGATINFLLSRRWVFANNAPITSSAPKFAVTAISGLCINALTLSLLLPLVGLVAAQIIATSCVLIVGFHVNRCWTFALGAA